MRKQVACPSQASQLLRCNPPVTPLQQINCDSSEPIVDAFIRQQSALGVRKARLTYFGAVWCFTTSQLLLLVPRG